MKPENVLVWDDTEDGEVVHLPGDSMLDTHTLCGWAWPKRLGHTTKPVTCKACLGHIKHVLAVAAERGLLPNPRAKKAKSA